MKIKDYRDRSLNAERRTSSPLKLSLQHIPGGLNKTPSAQISPGDFHSAGNSAKNWTSEVKTSIVKLSTQKMRANHYAQERASMSTQNSFPSQLAMANQTTLKMYDEKA